MRNETRMSVLLSFSFLLALWIAPSPSHGSLVTYTSRVAYDAATMNNQLVDFEGLDTVVTFYNPFTSGGVTFGSTTPGSTGNVWYAPNAWYGNASDALTIQAGSPNEFTIDLPVTSTYTSVGVDLFMFSGSDTLTITTPDGSSTSISATNSYTFLGFTSTIPFSSLTITGGGSNFGIDNFDFGDAIVQVPEPSSAVVILSGLLIALSRRRRV